MSAAKRTTAGSRPSRKPADDVATDGIETRGASNGDEAEERIRQRAYEIFCARNECDGTELEDWLAAERETRSRHSSHEKHAPVLLDRVADDDRRQVMR